MTNDHAPSWETTATPHRCYVQKSIWQSRHWGWGCYTCDLGALPNAYYSNWRDAYTSAYEHAKHTCRVDETEASL